MLNTKQAYYNSQITNLIDYVSNTINFKVIYLNVWSKAKVWLYATKKKQEYLTLSTNFIGQLKLINNFDKGSKGIKLPLL